MDLDKMLPTETRTFILAGGRGNRLLPLTADCPKPAVAFGGIFRIVDFTLSNCLDSGLSGIRLITQYKCEELHQYVEHSWGPERRLRPDAGKILCLPPVSGKAYRGTADAIFQNLAAQEPLPEFVLVLSADHIYRMDYREMLRQHIVTRADLTIGTVERPVEEASRCGVIDIDKNFRVVGFEEKPAHPRPLPDNPGAALVSMGVYVFRTDCLRQALHDDAESKTSAHDFGKDIIPRLVQCARVFSYDFREPVKKTPRYWRDIGTVDAYYESNMDLVSPAPSFDPFHDRRWPAFCTGASVRGGRVKGSVLSPGVRIEDGAEVENAVLMRGVRVGAGARIRRAIIQENVNIPAGATIGLNPESDRRRYFVSETGVTVVGQPVKETRPVSVCNRVAVFVPASLRLEQEARKVWRVHASSS